MYKNRFLHNLVFSLHRNLVLFLFLKLFLLIILGLNGHDKATQDKVAPHREWLK